MPTDDEPVPPLIAPDPERRRDAELRRARRRLARRKTLRARRRIAAGALLAAALAVAVAVIAGTHPAARLSSADKAPSSTASPAHAPRPVGQADRVAPSPGYLPQTRAYPSGSGAQFKSLMAALWAGIVRDSVEPALAAFFPKGAYLQLKAIGSPGSDWTGRLVHDYALDIAAAHALLGRDAALAELIAVDVPAADGHWVPPGTCDNRIGYFEVPNARIVYREQGAIRSFGIASMISWRGVWYVVHMGAIVRSVDAGAVDEPTGGPGTSLYSGTC